MTRFLLGLFIALAASVSSAQNFPTKTVTVIIGVAPGGTLDTLARQIAAGRGPDVFRARLEKDSARVAALVKAIGLKPEN